MAIYCWLLGNSPFAGNILLVNPYRHTNLWNGRSPGWVESNFCCLRLTTSSAAPPPAPAKTDGPPGVRWSVWFAISRLFRYASNAGLIHFDSTTFWSMFLRFEKTFQGAKPPRAMGNPLHLNSLLPDYFNRIFAKHFVFGNHNGFFNTSLGNNQSVKGVFMMGWHFS